MSNFFEQELRKLFGDGKIMRLNKRLENRGQLGYFLVSDALLPAVRRITHHMDILASDHRPISPTRCLATFRKELPDKE